jgi:hypothetical protein
MQAMPLTPILRRTFAIFRERPLLFTAWPFVQAVLLFQPRGGVKDYAPLTEIAHGLWVLLLCVAGSIFISGFICALAVDAEDEISISGTRSWNRVLNQSRLVGTALKIDLLFFAVLIFWLIVLKIFVAVCATMGVISAQSAASLTFSHTVFDFTACSLTSVALCGLSLAIPLLFVRRPRIGIPYQPLRESRRITHGIFWPLAAISLLGIAPYYVLRFIGDHIPLAPAFSEPAFWMGQFLRALLGAIATTLSFIALTLIALDRNAADEQQKTLHVTNAAPHSPSQVVIL